jgi:dCTP deaminase
VDDFRPERIDRASYRLAVGPEVYVSPTGEPDDPRNKPKTQLAPGQGFSIPAGQFGFILTEERIKVPVDAIAFISIRAGYKFRGLVNVSGFHVDPHYEGRLIFAVFNAGPGPVHLSRGEACFLIWYADVDRPSDLSVKRGFDSLPSDLTGPIAGGLQSFAGLLSKITENDKKLTERISNMERDQAVIRWGSALLLAAFITLGLRECSLPRTPSKPPPETVAPVPKSTPTPPAIAPSTTPAKN